MKKLTLHELIEKFEKSSDKKMYQHIKRLEMAINIYKNQFKILVNYIDSFSQKTKATFEGTRPKYLFISRRKNARLYEKLIIKLGSYLAATYALENITQQFLKLHPYTQGYKEFKTLLSCNGDRLLLFGLRNYITHYDIFPFSISIQYSKEFKDNAFTGTTFREGIMLVKKQDINKYLEKYDYMTGEKKDVYLLKQDQHQNILRGYILKNKSQDIKVINIVNNYNTELTGLLNRLISRYYKKYPSLIELDKTLERGLKLQYAIMKNDSDEKF